MSIKKNRRLFGLTEVCQIARIAPSTLRQWSHRGINLGEQEGRSRHRRYTAEWITGIIVMGVCMRRGIKLIESAHVCKLVVEWANRGSLDLPCYLILTFIDGAEADIYDISLAEVYTKLNEMEEPKISFLAINAHMIYIEVLKRVRELWGVEAVV